MIVRPIPLREARRFVAEHHRHSDPPHGWLFGAQLLDGETVVGVGIAGRPVAQGLQDGLTVEVLRVCVLDDERGRRNACSMLYGALCRAAKALGYERAITYTEDGEAGSSVRAAGFAPVAAVDGKRSWDSKSRRREDETLFGPRRRRQIDRTRWERAL